MMILADRNEKIYFLKAGKKYLFNGKIKDFQRKIT